jgi:ABC-2 type transport system permease protein
MSDNKVRDGINWYGAYSMTLRETHRFFRVYHQSIIAPISTAMIFLCIFSLSIGNHRAEINNVPFIEFMALGLIMMSMIQNAFANSSSSLIMSKVIGYITDILMPPLQGFEIVLAYVTSSIIRSIIIGVGIFFIMLCFINFDIKHPLYLVFVTIGTCIFFANLGIIAGLVSNTFDQMSALTNYVIMPLSFLSGTFYSTHQLPDWLQMVDLINPFFYMIDGFRYCFIDHADSNLFVGAGILTIGNVMLWILTVHLINIGWRLKS